MSRKESNSMSSKALTLGLFACILVCGVGPAQDAQANYGGGAGELNDPYQIWTPDQFVAICTHPEDWDSHFRLMADVNLVDVNSDMINPIGNRSVPFSGVFDGNDFAIENFTFDREDIYDAGIFGLVSTVELMEQINPDADAPWYEFDYKAHVYEPNESVVHIKNLQIVNVTVAGSRHVGGLSGRCFGGIENCQIKGGKLLVYPEPHSSRVVSGRRDPDYYDSRRSARRYCDWRAVGAVAGHLVVGRLEACHASRVIIEGDLTGGLIGFSDEATVHGCSFSGQISSNVASGGLIGKMIYTEIHRSGADVHIVGEDHNGGLGGAALGCRISQSYAMGKIEGSQSLGGLLGYSFGSLIHDCYAQCDVNSVWHANQFGGFVGQSEYDSIRQCYCAGQITPAVLSYGSHFGAVGGSFIGERTFDDFERQLIQASFWDGEVSSLEVGISYSHMVYSDNNVPIDEITSLSTQAMMSQETFTSAGWDFDSVWAIDEGVDYPVFQWALEE
jgi:hypothetical protein